MPLAFRATWAAADTSERPGRRRFIVMRGDLALPPPGHDTVQRYSQRSRLARVVDTPRGQRFRPVVYHVARHRGEVLALVLKGHKKKPPQAAGAGQSEFFPHAQMHEKTARP